MVVLPGGEWTEVSVAVPRLFVETHRRRQVEAGEFATLMRGYSLPSSSLLRRILPANPCALSGGKLARETAGNLAECRPTFDRQTGFAHFGKAEGTVRLSPL